MSEGTHLFKNNLTAFTSNRVAKAFKSKAVSLICSDPSFVIFRSDHDESISPVERANSPFACQAKYSLNRNSGGVPDFGNQDSF